MRLFALNSKSMSLGFMLLLFFLSTATAQQVNIQRSHAINKHSTLKNAVQVHSSNDSLHIVAVRVAFQPDTNDLTTGDGTYRPGNLAYLDTSTVTIDPLPHDQSYFEAHLKFAENYYEKVSNGEVNIDYRILPDIYRLDHKMEYYSPTGESFTNEPLAHFVRDVWQKVKQQGGFDANGLDPEHTAFAIFHAGVGRDIKLTGTSLNITPQDIPSIFMGEDQLRKHLPDFTGQGFSINNGSFYVNNSMILPRTLSRPGTTLGADYVLQLSINGLLTASIGSYLGLPDLFNTKTGNAGIGRFGLMDGASFFSYSGLFPPEPSAWEKSYLGWQDPVEIELNPQRHIELPTVSRHRPRSIARYSISSDEYFLVETRHRDPEQDGATLTIRTRDGQTVQQHFTNQDEVFTYQQEGFDTLFTPGVVTDVDNFDFSLPGGLDRGPDEDKGTDDDRLLNGGILIWHIDEAVIEANLATQSVNQNPDRRGVDLEEADGAQDIGSTIGTGLGGADSRGGPFDFWWSGNNASVITRSDTISLYQNRFGPDTRPSSHSNSGAPGFFAFTDFSDNQPVARFKAIPSSPANIEKLDLPVNKLEGSFMPPDDSYYEGYPWDITLFTHRQDSFLVIPSNERVTTVDLNPGRSQAVSAFPMQHPQQPYVDNQLVIAQYPTQPEQVNSNETRATDPVVEAWSRSADQWQQNWETSITNHLGFLSSRNGDTLHTDLGRTFIDLSSGNSQTSSGKSFQESARQGDNTAHVTRDALTYHAGSDRNTLGLGSGQNSWRLYTGIFPLTSNQTGFYVLRNNEFYFVDPSDSEPSLQTIANAGESRQSRMEWPAMVDITRDGRTDILYIDRQQNVLTGKNQNGATLDHFPIQAPDGTDFMGTPLVADIDGNSIYELLVVGQDSLSMKIYGYSNEGDKLSSFPLYVGSISQSGGKGRFPHPVLIGKKLFAVGHRGDLKGWRFPDMTDALWRSRYNRAKRNKVSGNLDATSEPDRSPHILKYSETYNWPNPSDEQTHIRYQLQASGTVQIKIVDMSGSTIFDRTYQARGGVPEEKQITTSAWGSGVYYALVKATVNGTTEKKLIKIAVVH